MLTSNVYGPVLNPADLAFLKSKGITEVRTVCSSFFKYPPHWTCPLCGAEKHSLLHRRKNGQWFSGIEVHHHSKTAPSKDELDYLLNNDTDAICYLCNGAEKEMRVAEKKLGLPPRPPLSLSELRNSDEFARRRAKKRVRNTFGSSHVRRHDRDR